MPKTSFSKNGFTLLELLVVLAILSILTSVLIAVLNPARQLAKSRDARRLTDSSALFEAVQEYHLDNASLPDASDTLRTSNTPGPSGEIYPSWGGWIDADMSEYLEKMHADPLNDSEYFYRYMHDGVGYEFDLKLEHFTERHTTDGGNNPDRLEMGTDLQILD